MISRVVEVISRVVEVISNIVNEIGEENLLMGEVIESLRIESMVVGRPN